MPTSKLTSCQENALEILKSHENVFLTGVAGSGKSFLIRHFLKGIDTSSFPILASTGAAAILMGGRTFHSFFGLGIMQGGFDATIERALGDKRVVKRIKGIHGVVIDEISMLSGMTLRAAETICRLARKKSIPWGGLRVIAVGDFAQLPPVTPHQQQRDWAFLDQTWERSQFVPAILNTVMRTKDREFLEILNFVRQGEVNEQVITFLDRRVNSVSVDDDFEGTRFVPHRDSAERFNLKKLETISGKRVSFETVYSGDKKALESLRNYAPVPGVLILKEDALVMLRQNDPGGRWVNGSLGYVRAIDDEALVIELLDNGVEGPEVEVEKVAFSLLNSEGLEVAAAKNFPVNLAYAATIHKSQGMSLDRVLVDLRGLWEPGQAYVALSRAKSAKGLHLMGWSPGSIRVDSMVSEFYQELMDRY